MKARFIALFVLLNLIHAPSWSQINCDDSQAPVVFVHGFLASGDTYSTQIQRFATNGHCEDRYFAFDWNSLNAAGTTQLLDTFIDTVRSLTGSDKVHLVGHSAGGGQGYSYLNDPARAAKVISYAHLGSSPESFPAGPNGSIPTLNVYSTADLIVEGEDILGATNVKFDDLDHYEVATSDKTFSEMYRFFYGSDPRTTEIEPSNEIEISGRCITLGENRPTVGANIEVFAADEQGAPVGQAIGSFDIDASGQWGPIDVDPNTYYLFKITSDAPGFRKVIYYYEPFIRNNTSVYLRTFPPAFSLAGLLLAAIPNTDEESVISIFSSTQAVIHGRDKLNIEGIDLAGPQLASSEASMIALFCYDDGRDDQGTGERIGSFNIVPFLQGADVPISPQPEQTWKIEFNGSVIPVRNWRSQSDGVVIAVFNGERRTTSVKVETQIQSVSLNVYPNPVDDVLNIKLAGGNINPDQVWISDLKGQVLNCPIKEGNKGEVIIDSRLLIEGVYMVSTQSEQQIISQAFRVKR